MTITPKTLVAGIGSGHGDDQVGWQIADRLASTFEMPASVVVRRAQLPLDVLDWLDGIQTLHLCDACISPGEHATYRRLTWNREKGHAVTAASGDISAGEPMHTMSLRSRGSHDCGLTDVLRLAAVTGRLPRTVVVWAVTGTNFAPGSDMSVSVRCAADLVARKIFAELAAAQCDLPGPRVRSSTRKTDHA